MKQQILEASIRLGLDSGRYDEIKDLITGNLKDMTLQSRSEALESICLFLLDEIKERDVEFKNAKFLTITK